MEQIIREYEKTLPGKPEVDIHPGDLVRVHVNIIEGGKEHVPLKKIHRIAAKGKGAEAPQKVERVQVFEGTVIALRGDGMRKKITVRKISSGIGVEKTWFVNSPTIAKIEVVRRSVVRRAKLYYLRDRVGKATRLKEKRPAQIKSHAGGEGEAV